MALKPTIFKFTINLADLNRNCFEDLSLTVTLSRPAVFVAGDRGELDLALIALTEP